MRELDDAMKALSDFDYLVSSGLHPEKSLEKVTYKDQWEEWSCTTLEFRVGQLKVEALAHITDSDGLLSARVWHSGKESDDDCIFDLYADVKFVARTVVDYIKKHEDGGMTDTATLDRVYMTLGGLQADAKGMNNHMRAGIEYAIERMEAALIEALQSNKY